MRIAFKRRLKVSLSKLSITYKHTNNRKIEEKKLPDDPLRLWLEGVLHDQEAEEGQVRLHCLPINMASDFLR